MVTPEALAPFRTAQPPRPEGDPGAAALPAGTRPTSAKGALALELEVLLLTAGAEGEGPAAAPPLAQRRAAHVLDGGADGGAPQPATAATCAPGDLLGTGTISAPGEEGFGSLLETTRGGKKPVALASGEERRFLEDGDEVFLRARARREGFATIGFGECRGVVLPAPASGS